MKNKKEIRQQILCKKCGSAILPLYEKELKKLCLYCPNCNFGWSLPATVSLTDELKLYED